MAVEVQSATERAPVVLPDLAASGTAVSYAVVSALAARADDGSLLISVVNRGTAPATPLRIDLTRFSPAPRAEVWSLSAAVPWAVNSSDGPDAVKPVVNSVPLSSNSLSLELRSYTLLRIRVPPAR